MNPNKPLMFRYSHFEFSRSTISAAEKPAGNDIPAGCWSHLRIHRFSLGDPVRVFSGMSAVSPSRWLAASSVGKPLAAERMANRPLVPERDNQFEWCRRPGCNRCPEGIHQDRIRRWNNRLRSLRTGSTAARNSHSVVKQHKHSPAIEQGVSWESFPQDSGRDRIVDIRIAKLIRRRCRVQIEKSKMRLGGKSEGCE